MKLKYRKKEGKFKMQQIVVCRVPSEQAEEEEILAALELW